MTLLDLQQEIIKLVQENGRPLHKGSETISLEIPCDDDDLDSDSDDQVQRITKFADLVEEDENNPWSQQSELCWYQEYFQWQVHGGKLTSGRLDWNQLYVEELDLFEDTDDFLNQYLGKYLAANPEEAIKFKACLTPQLQEEYNYLFGEFDMF